MNLLLSSIVVKAKGLTPQLVASSHLEEVFTTQPNQSIATPVLAVLDYPDGYQVSVQEDRIDVTHQRPNVNDAVAQDAVLHLLSLWPLAQPTAIGLNFQYGGTYDESELTQADLARRF